MNLRQLPARRLFLLLTISTMVKPRAKKAAKAQDNQPPIFVAEDLDPVAAARNRQIAEKAAQTHRIAAEKAKRDAETEYNNKLRCLEFEKMSTLKVVNEVPLHTDTPSTFTRHQPKESAWSIGMYVRGCFRFHCWDEFIRG